MEASAGDSSESLALSVIESSGRRITVYRNSLGDAVVRQAASGGGVDVRDDVIVIRQAGVPALLDAIEQQSARAERAADM